MRGKPPGLLGVVHLLPLPGSPRARSLSDVRERALQDAEAMRRGGVDGCIVENFGDAPFHRGDREDPVPPHVVACLALLAREIAAKIRLPVGINCLRNDALGALGAAAAAELQMIRVNVHTGCMVTDQGLIQGRAAETVRYRKSLGVDVAILADVLVKHAAPLAARSLTDVAIDTAERGLADALIVTGSATAKPVDADELRAVRAAVAVPVLIGSGLDPDNAGKLWPLCDGALVGTWMHGDGDLEQPVDLERVRRLRKACTWPADPR
jgi:membrane complex biogenesis BtpA family protein